MYGLLNNEKIPYDKLTWEQLCNSALLVVDDGMEPRELSVDAKNGLARCLFSVPKLLGIENLVETTF